MGALSMCAILLLIAGIWAVMLICGALGDLCRW